MTEETWKFIEGTNSKYMVSSFGRIKSTCRVIPILMKFKNIRGYSNLTIVYDDNKRRMRQVHRLVAEAFIPNPNNLPQVNHINHIKNDNRIENLEWVTNSQNIKHSYLDNNRTQVGDANNGSVMTTPIVTEIKRRGKYATYTEIANDMNTLFNTTVVTRSNVFNILKNKSWCHIKI